ncbi:PDZ_CTP_protease domain containing protein [Fimbriimonadaceae bacterium]
MTSLLALITAQAAAPIVVPFRQTDSAILVDITANGKKMTCMFDTGYGGTLLLASNLNIGPSTGVQELRDFVGSFAASTVKLKSMSIGGLNVPAADRTIVVMPNDMSASYGTHVDGILGLDGVRDHVMEINFEKNQFIFHPKSVDVTKKVPDNKRTFLAKLLPIGGSAMELAVQVSTGKKLTLALDTGNGFYATTHKDSLERVGLWKEGTKPKYFFTAGVASGAVDSWYYRMKNATIFGVPVQESSWSVIDLPSSSADSDGTIGFQFLKNFNIICDYERRRVWLENFTGKVSDDSSSDVGIRAGFNNERKRTIIFAVAPDSPAEVAGIKVGDQLLSVDGQEQIEGTYERIEKLMKGPKGSKVKLVTSRNGEVKRYEIERKELLND